MTTAGGSSIKNDLIDTYFADARRRFPRRKYVLKGINDLLEADLLDINQYKEFNDGYWLILVVINCFSKFAFARPLKSKTAKEVTNAMNDILKTVFPPIRNLHTDRGVEFYNSSFKSLMTKYNINHYSSYSEIKAAFVERFNRTLRKLLIKESFKRNNPRWLDYLQDVINIYNNTEHSVTKIKPAEVTFNNEKIILRRLTPNRTKPKRLPKYEEGDFVHISRKQNIFDKGKFNWTPLVFQIRKVVHEDGLVTYRLRDTEGKREDILGTFYSEELKPAKHGLSYVVEKVVKKVKKGKKNMLLVKWLGFSDKYNSLITEENLL